MEARVKGGSVSEGSSEGFGDEELGEAGDDENENVWVDRP
jgi:hypothetical protein